MSCYLAAIPFLGMDELKSKLLLGLLLPLFVAVLIIGLLMLFDVGTSRTPKKD